MRYRARYTFECQICHCHVATWSHVAECARRREEEESVKRAIENGKRLIEELYGKDRDEH